MQAFTDSHHRRFLATRTNLFDDADWYHSDYYHEYRQPCGLDEWLHSQFHIPGLGGTHMICLSRAPGDCRFTDGERRLLGLFHDELRLVWGDEPPVATATVADEIAALPPRLRETLDRLLVGDSEKQVADRLSVSYHAVHANVKRLHRRFNVSSRGELLAKVNQKPAASKLRFQTAPSRPAGRLGETAQFDSSCIKPIERTYRGLITPRHPAFPVGYIQPRERFAPASSHHPAFCELT